MKVNANKQNSFFKEQTVSHRQRNVCILFIPQRKCMNGDLQEHKVRCQGAVVDEL
jgi:hypothetical protein